MMIYERKEHQK